MPCSSSPPPAHRPRPRWRRTACSPGSAGTWAGGRAGFGQVRLGCELRRDRVPEAEDDRPPHQRARSEGSTGARRPSTSSPPTAGSRTRRRSRPGLATAAAERPAAAGAFAESANLGPAARRGRRAPRTRTSSPPRSRCRSRRRSLGGVFRLSDGIVTRLRRPPARPELHGLQLCAAARTGRAGGARGRVPARARPFLRDRAHARRALRRRPAAIGASTGSSLTSATSRSGPTRRCGKRRSGCGRTHERRTAPSSRSRPGSARPAASPTTSRRRRPEGAAARALRRRGQAWLLPALRRRDGADAAVARHPRARRRRVHERQARGRRLDRDRPQRPCLGRGLVPGLRLAALRPDSGAGLSRRDLQRLLVRLQRRRCRGRDSSAAPGGSTGAAPISCACSRRRSGWRSGPRRAAAPATRAGARCGCSSCSLLAAVAAIGLAKLVRRRSRYLTRDPRRLAGAARRELVDFLADQGIAVSASATPEELHQLVRAELGGDGRRVRPRAREARFGPPEASAAAATSARRELREPPARRSGTGSAGPPACAACSRSARCGRDPGRGHRGGPRYAAPAADRALREAGAADRREAGARAPAARARRRRRAARDRRHGPPRRAGGAARWATAARSAFEIVTRAAAARRVGRRGRRGGRGGALPRARRRHVFAAGEIGRFARAYAASGAAGRSPSSHGREPSSWPTGSSGACSERACWRCRSGRSARPSPPNRALPGAPPFELSTAFQRRSTRESR